MALVYFPPKEKENTSTIIIQANERDPIPIAVDPSQVESLLEGKDAAFTEIGMRSGEKFHAINYSLGEVGEMLRLL